MSNSVDNTFKISDIIKRIEDEYNLDLSSSAKAALYKKIISICKNLPSKTNEKNFLEASVRPVGSRQDHFFSLEEVNFLINLSELQDYISERFLDYEQREKFAQDNALAKKQNRAAIRAEIEMQGEEGVGGEEYYKELYDGVVISSEELRLKKLEIMVEALFLRYFTPIDEEQLKKDMTISRLVAGTTDHTAESVDACNRLKDYKSYYKPLKPDGKN